MRLLESNRALLLYASQNTPCLILDCANCANPHALFPHVDEHSFQEMYVIPIDIIYKLRDTLKTAGQIAKKVGAETIVITFERLFNYDNQKENREIYTQSWNLVKRLSSEFDVATKKWDIQ